MSSRKILAFLTFPAFILAGLTQANSLRSLNAGNSDSTVQQQKDEDDLPIADLTVPEITDPEKRSLRRLRSSRHDIHDRTSDAKRFMLTEDSPPVLLQLQASHVSPEPALPVTQSDAIIIAEVTDAQAYLSSDQTSVYSEFTLRVNEVLQKSFSAPLSTGVLLTAERPGGRVRFPSGKILVRGGSYGRNMPVKGRRYVLFLKQVTEAQSFSIITGYELRAGHVFPLDHTPRGESPSRQFVNYESYSGKEEAALVTRLTTNSRSL